MEDIPDQPDLVVKSISDVPHDFTGIVYELEHKACIWYLNGKIHRDDGPAIIHHTGSKFWWVNGKCHKLSGPASVWSGGTTVYYIHGVIHTQEEFYNNHLVVNFMVENIMKL